MAAGGKLVYQFLYDVLVTIDGSMRQSRIPYEGGNVESSRYRVAFQGVGHSYDGHMRIEGGNVIVGIAALINLGQGGRFETSRTCSPYL